MDHFFVRPMNKLWLCTLIPVNFVVILVSPGFSVILGRMPPKTHVGPHVAFPTTKTSGRLLIFDELSVTNFVFVSWQFLNSYYGSCQKNFIWQNRWLIFDVLPRLTLCLVSWQFLDRYYGSCRHFFHLEEKNSPSKTPFLSTKTPQTWIFLCSYNSWIFILVSVVSTGISVFGGENLPKTHIGPSVAFPTTKTPARWIVFLCSVEHRLCVLFSDGIWTVIMVSIGISFIWRKNDPKYSHRVTSTLSNDRNTWEMDLFHVLPVVKSCTICPDSFRQFTWFLKM